MEADAARELTTDRLVLESLSVEHADEMVSVLADPVLYEFTGGEPPNLDALARRYRAQVAGSGSLEEEWLNWMIRSADSGQLVGFVQATVVDGAADLAWLIGVAHQGRGFAIEAVRAMVAELEARGVGRFAAQIHPGHVRSRGVAAAAGLERTDEVDEDGEEIWASSTDLA